MNINSDEIIIYPVANRLDGKLNIENNIVNQKLDILDVNSFMISPSESPLSIVNNMLNINESTYVINGYYIKLSPIDNINIKPVTQNDYNRWVTLSIRTKTKNIDNLYIEELFGEDIDSKYTAVSINLSEELPLAKAIDTEDNSITYYNFILGLICYDQDIATWKLAKTSINLNTKLSFNNMLVDIQDSSITNIQGTMPIDNWLNNNFILDDGEI